MSTPAKNILVIRSATRVLNQTIHLLKQEFPDSRITVLGAGSVKDNLLLDPSIDAVIPVDHKKGPMTVFSVETETLRTLRANKFDLAVGLYNIDHGQGYSNIDLLAWSTHPGQIRGYNPQGKFTVHTGRSICKKMALEKTASVWIAANYLATAILFLLITLGLCAEWCWRKVKTTPQPAEPLKSETAKKPTPLSLRAECLTRTAP